MRIFRVTVRGWFDGLDDERRAALLAVADDHDVVSVGAYTEAGTLPYERSLPTFTFRLQRRAQADDAEAGVLERATALDTGRPADPGARHRAARDRKSPR